MNKYYYDFIIQKLKDDIMKDLSTNENLDIVKNEIDEYFLTNEIIFNHNLKNTGTHQVRNRIAYQNKENKCKALVWNEGHGGQCSRQMKDGCNGFCKTHFSKGGDEWWLGTIEKRVESPVDSKGKFHIWLEHR